MRIDITHARLRPDDVAEQVEKLEAYTEHLREVTKTNDLEADEASINLPSDLAQREVVGALHQELQHASLKYIFLLGIGGSNLGTKAIYDALTGFEDAILQDHTPRIIFVDTNETALISSVTKLIEESIQSPEEFLAITISKSGGTTETIVNTEIILSKLYEKCGDSMFERIVAITGEDSAFDRLLREKNIRTVYIPEKVGGRYSVFSPVGLFPLLTAHIDVDGLLAGALDMRNECLKPEFSANNALQSAIVHYIHARDGRRISTHFIFHPQLESLGKWYRQLLAESIGKHEDRSGNVVCAGITPEISIGSTDLHSMAQLYLGGPHDKLTTFIKTTKSEEGVEVPKNRFFSDIVPEVSCKNTEDVMSAIYEGTMQAYQDASRPYMEVVFEDLSPYEIGAFMQFKMIEVMYLGVLFDVNPFDQPSVEQYKIETKKRLKE